MQILRYSRLYESAAAYVTDQPAFLNAAVAVQTQLDPHLLLKSLKDVEVIACLPLRPCPQAAKPFLEIVTLNFLIDTSSCRQQLDETSKAAGGVPDLWTWTSYSMGQSWSSLKHCKYLMPDGKSEILSRHLSLISTPRRSFKS